MRRRLTYSRGRWAVERERHRLADAVPPGGGHEAPVAEVLNGLMKRLGINDEVWMKELESAWPEIVGAAIAAHARPGRYEKGVLSVFVDSAVWLHELKRSLHAALLAKIQKRFTAERIRSVRYLPDPDWERRPR